MAQYIKLRQQDLLNRHKVKDSKDSLSEENKELPLNFTGNSYGLYKVNTCLWVDWSSK